MRNFLSATAFLLLGIVPNAESQAALLIYQMTGVLDNDIGPYDVGTAFSGGFSYETENNPDTYSDPLENRIGYYEATSIWLTIEGEMVSSDGGLIIIENQVNGGDRLVASWPTTGTLGGYSNPIVRWNLRANGGLSSTVFSDDSLPQTLLDPADFTDNPRMSFAEGDGTPVGGGVFSTLEGSVGTVPEPNSMLLLGLCGLTAGATARRRRCRSGTA